MKVTFEFDDNILEETELQSTLFFNEKLKQVIAREIKNQLIEEYVKLKPDFGDLGITKEEIKEAVINEMARIALQNKNVGE